MSGIAGEEPDPAVTDLHGIGLEREPREAPPVAVIGNSGGAPLPAILPAMIGAYQPAALHLADGEFELAVRTAVLDRLERAVRPPEQRDGTFPEDDFDHRPRFDPAHFLDRVPVVRVHTRGARLLTQAGGFLEAGRRARRRAHIAPPPRRALSASGRLASGFAIALRRW